MRRFLAVGLASLAVVAVSAGVALAAKPVAGEWHGTKSLNFTVNSAGTRITQFAPGGCAAGPLSWTMKVAANGSFSLKKKLGLEGGKPVQFKIKGRFTAPTTAAGSISYGKCKQKFKATGPAPAPTEPAPTEPAPQDEPPTTS